MTEFTHSPGNAQGNDDAVDLSVIEQLKASLGDDEEFVAELISQFLENTPRLLGEIGTAIENTNPEGLQLSAHSLKSTCATLGANTMTKLAFELEMCGRENNMDGTVDVAAQLNEAYDFARGMFENRLRNAA